MSARLGVIVTVSARMMVATLVLFGCAVDRALITSDLWPTRRGLRVGDSTTRMRALYGTPQRNAVEDFEYYTSDQEKGLVLMVFDSVGVVRSMYLQVSR